MPVWVSLYLGVLVFLSVAGIVDDFRSRKPRWWVAVAVTSAVASVGLVLNYWGVVPPLSTVTVVALLLLAVLFDGISGLDDLRSMRPDPELSASENRNAERFAVALGFVMMVPAYLFGVASILR